MAEVIWREISEANWNCWSAGSKPSGHVHPMAIRAIEEIGLPTDGLNSKSVNKVDLAEISLIVTVCDNARNDCPVLPSHAEVLHWPFDDPADAIGTDEEKMAVFRRVRDEIRTTIQQYLGVEDDG